jgi:hypothetical protein
VHGETIALMHSAHFDMHFSLLFQFQSFSSKSNKHVWWWRFSLFHEHQETVWMTLKWLYWVYCQVHPGKTFFLSKFKFESFNQDFEFKNKNMWCASQAREYFPHIANYIRKGPWNLKLCLKRPLSFANFLNSENVVLFLDP